MNLFLTFRGTHRREIGGDKNIIIFLKIILEIRKRLAPCKSISLKVRRREEIKNNISYQIHMKILVIK